MAEARMMCDVKATSYKDRNARENAFRTLAELFEIPQNFSK